MERDIGSLTLDVLGDTDLTVASVEQVDRLYSTIWTVDLARNGQRESYIVKHRPETAKHEYRLSRRADELFHDDPSYCCLQPHVDPTGSFIVTRRSTLPVLEHRLFRYAWQNPLAWFRNLDRSVHLAGAWLKRYHAADPSTGPMSPGFLRYLENRESALQKIGAANRTRLVQAVTSATETRLVTTHCDFSLQNILTDGRHIAVVDYGIREWTKMSPYWDVATFILDLESQARFRLKSPLHWLSSLRRRLTSSFLSAYCGPHDSSDPEWLLCAAVRYFSLFAGTIDRHGARATWYQSRLAGCLDRLDRGTTPQTG